MTRYLYATSIGMGGAVWKFEILSNIHIHYIKNDIFGKYLALNLIWMSLLLSFSIHFALL